MIKKLLFAGACFGVLGLVGTAPAQANGWHRPYPAYKGHGHFGGYRFAGPTYRHHTFAAPRHRWHGHFRHYGHRYVRHHYGYYSRPAARVWGNRFVPTVAAPVVSVGYVQPAYTAVSATYSYAIGEPVCGSYAAPIGYHGVIYNRPLCPCYC